MKKLWPLLPSEKVAASEARVVGNLLTAAGTCRLHLRQPPGAHHLEKRGAGINVCEHDVLGWSRDRGRRGRCRAGLVESRCRTLGVQCDMVFNVGELDGKVINTGRIRD